MQSQKKCHSGVLLVISLVWFPPVLVADQNELRVLSWNIANLAEAGVEHRGYEREQVDIERLREEIIGFDADIIALQEITSITVASQVLGDQYHLQFERRCHGLQLADKEVEQCKEKDIYTVIAYHDRIKDRVQGRFQLSQLAISHESGCPGHEIRKVRGAPGLVISNDGEPDTLVVSVHLKASCKSNKHENAKTNPSQVDDCKTNEQQFDILNHWVRNNLDKRIIVAGDFNRRLLANGDNRYAQLSESNREFEIYPTAQEQANCFTPEYFDKMKGSYRAFDKAENGVDKDAYIQVYTPKSNYGIDHFVVFPPSKSQSSVSYSTSSSVMADARSEPPTDSFLTTCDGDPNYFEGSSKRLLVFAASYPSDHCPIALDF